MCAIVRLGHTRRRCRRRRRATKVALELDLGGLLGDAHKVLAGEQKVHRLRQALVVLVELALAAANARHSQQLLFLVVVGVVVILMMMMMMTVVLVVIIVVEVGGRGHVRRLRVQSKHGEVGEARLHVVDLGERLEAQIAYVHGQQVAVEQLLQLLHRHHNVSSQRRRSRR